MGGTSIGRALVLSAVALLIAACSAVESPEPPSPQAVRLVWTSVDPDPASTGGPSVLADWRGRLVGVGDRSAEAPSSTAWSSADGITYTTSNLPAPGPVVASDLVAGADGLLAVGGVWQGTGDDEHEVAAAWRSADGVTWSPVPEATSLLPADGYQSTWMRLVATTPRGFVATGTEWGGTGQRVVAWRSSDGVGWIRSATEIGGVNPNALLVIGSRVVLAATDWSSVGGSAGESGMFWWSDDAGSTWTRSGPSVDDVVPRALAVGAAGLVAVGHRWTASADPRGMAAVPAVWTSADGRAWTLAPWDDGSDPWPEATPLPSVEGPLQRSTLWAVLGSADGYLAVGSHDGIVGPWADPGAVPTMRSSVGLWWSPNGVDWVAAGTLADVTRAAPGGGATGRIASIRGQTVVVLQSLDGTTIWMSGS